jgi:hypothetical protein
MGLISQRAEAAWAPISVSNRGRKDGQELLGFEDMMLPLLP